MPSTRPPSCCGIRLTRSAPSGACRRASSSLPACRFQTAARRRRLVHEVKHDGYQLQVHVRSGRVRLSLRHDPPPARACTPPRTHSRRRPPGARHTECRPSIDGVAFATCPCALITAAVEDRRHRTSGERAGNRATRVCILGPPPVCHSPCRSFEIGPANESSRV